MYLTDAGISLNCVCLLLFSYVPLPLSLSISPSSSLINFWFLELLIMRNQRSWCIKNRPAGIDANENKPRHKTVPRSYNYKVRRTQLIARIWQFLWLILIADRLPTTKRGISVSHLSFFPPSISFLITSLGSSLFFPALLFSLLLLASSSIHNHFSYIALQVTMTRKRQSSSASYISSSQSSSPSPSGNASSSPATSFTESPILKSSGILPNLEQQLHTDGAPKRPMLVEQKFIPCAWERTSPPALSQFSPHFCTIGCSSIMLNPPNGERTVGWLRYWYSLGRPKVCKREELKWTPTVTFFSLGARASILLIRATRPLTSILPSFLPQPYFGRNVFLVYSRWRRESGNLDEDFSGIPR